MSYCDLADVSLVTRDNIKLSSALYAFSPDERNNGDIALSFSNLVMAAAYYGYRLNFEIRFDNALDLTQFRVYKQNDTSGSKALILIGAGNTGADLVIADVFTIGAAGWSGTAGLSAAGDPEDLIVVVSNSHMSENQMNSIIVDVSAEIDQLMRENAMISTVEGVLPANLYFVLNPPVPRQIKVAVAHIVAWRAFNYVFEATKSITKVGREEERDGLSYEIAGSWLKIAGINLKSWINGQKVQSGNAPRWTSMGPLVSGVGVTNQLQGVLNQAVDGDYTEPRTGIEPFVDIEALMGS